MTTTKVTPEIKGGRIGKLPVKVPTGVKVSVNNNVVSVEGPKGKLEKSFPAAVMVSLSEDTITVAPSSNSRFSRAMHGTARSIIASMVQGVVEVYVKRLTIKGVGFKAAVKGKVLDMALGYSHPVVLDIPEGITVVVEENTKITVSGPDKQKVGQFTADIWHQNKAEPYKEKGVKIVGQYVRRKEGKSV